MAGLRKPRSCLLALAAVVLVAAAAQPALARKPAPAFVIREAIFIHNGAVGVMFLQASQASGFYNDCLQVQNEPPDAQDWSGIEADGHAIQAETTDNWRPHNKRLLEWIAALETVKGKTKAAKGLKQEAISALRAAHEGHGSEFFSFDAAGTKLVLHDCQGYNDDLHAAAQAGDPAWSHEFHGLALARKLLHVKGKNTALSPEVGPWADAGVH